jgi:guanosine-3',5'-bis(diphosphate) 3'-pyrophosphohydrolase
VLNAMPEPTAATTAMQAAIEARYRNLERRIESYYPDPDFTLLRRSFSFANEHHGPQLRSSGEPYITHLLGVAEIIADLHLDMDCLCAALLHDVVEDTQVSLRDLEATFSAPIAALVDGVTKLSKLRFNTNEERQAETIRKMIVAMSRDIRVVLLKLADRLHNMRTLEHLPEAKQRRIAEETMDIYAPLANRFGIHWIKIELEDSAFRYLNRDAYYDLASRIAKKRRERERYITEVLEVLEEVMDENHIEAELQGRPKHFYSIWRKMKRQGIEFEQVYDVLAFRIIVEGKSQCYEALGVVHNLWKPIPARFKDYIAMPKPNGYQSLHTSVIGPNKEPLEIQIRTQPMHKVAEEGVAAHWLYKEKGVGHSPQNAAEFTWLRNLIDDFKEVSDPAEFMERLKLDLFSEEVFLFTPAGDIRALPTGATPIDFAYSIHTEVGNHCSGARVNGTMVPLQQELKSGDVVEIITRSTQRPTKDWLGFVRTGRARSKIRHFLRTEAREKAIEIGREHLEAELRRHGQNYKALLKKGRIDAAADAARMQSVDEMLMKLGYGTLPINQILRSITPDIDPENPPKPSASAKLAQAVSKRLPFKRRTTGVVIDGIEDDLMVRYANCCNPVPGEEIVGFITRGRGLTIHSADCDRIDYLEKERQLEVHWQESAIRDKSVHRTVRVEVATEDEPGMLAKMSDAFSVEGINIQEAHCRTERGGAINQFDLRVTDFDQLERAMARVRRIPKVKHVTRQRATNTGGWPAVDSSRRR